MAIIDSFTWLLESDSAQLKRDIEDSKNKVNELDSSFEKAEQSGVSAAEGIGVGFGKLLGVIASVASVAKLFDMANAYSNNTLALKNLSDQTGIAIEDMDGLQKGLQRVGVDSENTARAVTEITNAIGADSKALADYGIAAKDAAGNSRDTLDVLGDIAEQASKMSAQDASSFFKSLRITDPELINNLRKGRAELENLIRAEKAKGVVDKEQLELSKEYERVSNELSTAIGDIGDAISKFVLPIYTKLKAGVLAGIEVLSKHSGFLKIFAGVLTAVATPALLSFASAQLAAAAPILAAVAAVTAFALAIDDLMNFFEGNGSVIEDWAQQFGATQEQIDKFRDSVKEAFISIFEYWDDLMNSFADAPAKVSSTMSDISNTFRDKFNGIKKIVTDWIDAVLDAIRPLTDAISGIFSGAKSIGGFIGNLFGSNKSTAIPTQATEMMNSARNAPTNTISNSSIQNSKSSNQTNNQTNNITINTTADAKAIADKVKTTTKDGLSEFARQNRGGSLN
mgnify:CR=1 FL=1